MGSTSGGWAEGLSLLLRKLRQLECPRPLDDGQAVAAQSFLGKDVIGGMETLYSNCLRLRSLPETIQLFQAEIPIPDVRLKLIYSSWAFRAVSEAQFLSFHRPPGAIASEFGLKSVGDHPWRERLEIENIDSRSLVSELIRKSLHVKCIQKGLRLCPETALHYFPPGLLEKDKIWLTLPSGSRTWKQVVGERSFRQGVQRDRYRYYVAPCFSVRQDLGDPFIVLLRIRVRVTNPKGEVPLKRVGQARRKKLCKNWWNDDWFNLTIGTCQFLADPGGDIVLGLEPDEQIIVGGSVLAWPVPVGISEQSLSDASFDRSDLPLQREADDPQDID